MKQSLGAVFIFLCFLSTSALGAADGRELISIRHASSVANLQASCKIDLAKRDQGDSGDYKAKCKSDSEILLESILPVGDQPGRIDKKMKAKLHEPKS